jgi:hypothetical protein
MNFQIRHVSGHVEVYDLRGRFLFSADNIQEAMQELSDLEAA